MRHAPCQDAVQDLKLVRLAQLIDAPPRLLHRYLFACQRQVLADQAPHFFLRLLHDLVCEGLLSLGHVKIIVEASLDCRPYRDLCAGVYALHRHRHDVRAGVPDAQQLVRLCTRWQRHACQVGGSGAAILPCGRCLAAAVCVCWALGSLWSCCMRCGLPVPAMYAQHVSVHNLHTAIACMRRQCWQMPRRGYWMQGWCMGWGLQACISHTCFQGVRESAKQREEQPSHNQICAVLCGRTYPREVRCRKCAECKAAVLGLAVLWRVPKFRILVGNLREISWREADISRPQAQEEPSLRGTCLQTTARLQAQSLAELKHRLCGAYNSARGGHRCFKVQQHRFLTQFRVLPCLAERCRLAVAEERIQTESTGHSEQASDETGHGRPCRVRCRTR